MTDEPANEILAEAAAAKAHEEAAAVAKAGRRDRNWNLGRIGIGVGIGSAAVAAAVLFSKRRDGELGRDGPSGYGGDACPVVPQAKVLI